MASKIDGKGVLWGLFFVVVLLAIFDVLTPGSSLVDFFTGSQSSGGRLERAIDRAVDR